MVGVGEGASVGVRDGGISSFGVGVISGVGSVVGAASGVTSTVGVTSMGGLLRYPPDPGPWLKAKPQ